jgi:SMC interacting uncharacterized protein involved in chromosome segregation
MNIYQEETQEEMEVRHKRIDEAIRKINEQTANIKKFDRMIAEKRKLIKENGKISLNDLGLLPLIW